MSSGVNEPGGPHGRRDREGQLVLVHEIASQSHVARREVLEWHQRSERETRGLSIVRAPGEPPSQRSGGGHREAVAVELAVFAGRVLVLQVVDADLRLEQDAPRHPPLRIEPQHHVAVVPQAELVAEQQERDGIAVAGVEFAVDPREHRRLPDTQPKPVGQAHTEAVSEEVAMDPRPGRVGLIRKAARQRVEAQGLRPQVEGRLRFGIRVVAHADAVEPGRSPVSVHLAQEHGTVLELAAYVRLGEAPDELEIGSAGPFRIVRDPWLRSRTRDQRKRAEYGLAREVGVGTDAVGAKRMEHVPADVAERLSAGPAGDPPLGSRRVLELGAKSVDQLDRGCLAAGVGRGQDAHGIGPAERPHHGAGIVDLPARDQVLEQGQPRVVERDVW